MGFGVRLSEFNLTLSLWANYFISHGFLNFIKDYIYDDKWFKRVSQSKWQKKKKVTYISGSKKSQVKSKYKLTKYFHHKGQFFPSIQKGPKNKQKQRPTMYEK